MHFAIQLMAREDAGHSVAAQSGKGTGVPARSTFRGRAGGLCRWPRASGPDSRVCAPARSAPQRPEHQPAVPPFRPPEPAGEFAAGLRDGHSPAGYNSPSLLCHLPPPLYP